jgi:hypothetical protein
LRFAIDFDFAVKKIKTKRAFNAFNAFNAFRRSETLA